MLEITRSSAGPANRVRTKAFPDVEDGFPRGDLSSMPQLSGHSTHDTDLMTYVNGAIVHRDQAFLAGTSGAPTPVIEVDGRRISDGPGPVTRQLRVLY